MARKRITGSGHSRAQAKQRCDENYEAFISGTPRRRAPSRAQPPTEAEVVTVRALFEEWDAYNRTRNISETYKRAQRRLFELHILPEFGDIPLADLTRRDLLSFFTVTLPNKQVPKKKEDQDDGEQPKKRRRKRAAHTQEVSGPESESKKEQPKLLLGGSARRNIYMALSGALTYAVDQNYLPHSPLAGIQAPEKVELEEDIDAFVADMEIVREYLVNQAALHVDEARWLFAMLGLRRSERLGLAWTRIRGLNGSTPHVVISHQLARVPGQGLTVISKTKNKKPRKVALVEPWIGALQRYRQQWDRVAAGPDWRPEPKFQGLLFLQPNGWPICQRRLNTDPAARIEF